MGINIHAGTGYSCPNKNICCQIEIPLTADVIGRSDIHMESGSVVQFR